MLTVEKRDIPHLNEIAIRELYVPYTTVYQKDDKATLDIYIKTKDAVKLLKGLERALSEQDIKIG